MTATPRVAVSLDDLRPGMVIAWEIGNGEVRGGTIHGFGENCGVTVDGHIWDFSDHPAVVILSDPPLSPVTVSREAIDRLEKSLEGNWDQKMHELPITAVSFLLASARQVVAEVRGTDQ